MPVKSLIISEFKLNDHLKIDGRKVDVLLLGLRNDFYLHQKSQIATESAVSLLK